MDNQPTHVTFVTTSKRHAVIVQQPATFYEKFKTGAKKGQVKAKKQIQYVEHLSTIFVEEQKRIEENPRITPIYLTSKPLHVEIENITKIELLRSHPDNVANGGKIFKEFIADKEELLELQSFEASDKAKHSLMNADDNLIRTIAVWYLAPSYAYKTVQSLKLILRKKLEMNLQMANSKESFVESFNKFIESKNHDEKLMITMCLSEKIIKIADGKKVAWVDGGEIIFNGAKQDDVIKDLATWMKNDEEGRQVASVLADKLKALKGD